jgi:hypothetical protein
MSYQADNFRRKFYLSNRHPAEVLGKADPEINITSNWGPESWGFVGKISGLADGPLLALKKRSRR